jgi:hypothetical protein
MSSNVVARVRRVRREGPAPPQNLVATFREVAEF